MFFRLHFECGWWKMRTSDEKITNSRVILQPFLPPAAPRVNLFKLVCSLRNTVYCLTLILKISKITRLTIPDARVQLCKWGLIWALRNTVYSLTLILKISKITQLTIPDARRRTRTIVQVGGSVCCARARAQLLIWQQIAQHARNRIDTNFIIHLLETIRH